MSLRSFLEKMEAQNEVAHITDKMSPRFEIPSVINALADGPILMFENVDGYPVKVESPKPPKIVEEAPVKKVQEPPVLSKIPVLTHFEKDPGAYITSAVISARSVDGVTENVSIHRLQVLDDRHLAIRLVPRHLFKLWSMAKEEKRDLEISISIGVHPAVMLAFRGQRIRCG